MALRFIDIARFSIGCAELFATRRFASAELGRQPDDSEVIVARVLGARQVGQAVLSALFGFRRLGVVVDILHALSMVALATLGPERYRRAGMSQAASASTFAGWGIAAVRHSK